VKHSPRLRSNGWFVRIVLIFWLISAGFVLYFLGKIDWIVHHELYNYGLQFSEEWAVGYWAIVRMIYLFLALSFGFSVVYFCFEAWRSVKGEKVMVTRKPVKSVKPLSEGVEPVRENHMLISCPKCERVFSKPLVMLNFSGGGDGRLVNVCPYCNHVLGGADDGDKEKKRKGKNGVVEFVDLDRKEVGQE